jgi:predicted nucleic acid-binding protein
VATPSPARSSFRVRVPVFVDSSFWVGLVDRRDQWHPRAKQLVDRAASGSKLLDLTAAEALTIVGSRLGGKAARSLFEYFQDSCEILYVDPELLDLAMNRHLSHDGSLSVADCATVEAMVQRGQRSVLSFDSDFDTIKGITRVH